MTLSLSDDDLLLAVQSRPAIYDKSLKDHSNRELLKKLWDDVARVTGADVTLCKTRWNSMRDYFLRKYREGMRPGQVRYNGKRVWPYFNMLAFLIPHLSSSTINRESHENGETAIDAGDNSCDLGEDAGHETAEAFETISQDKSNAPVHSKIEARSRSPSPAPSETHNIRNSSLLHNTVRSRHALERKRKMNVSYSSYSPYDDRKVKVVKREENSHEHFFKSIQPMLERLSDIETLMFRSEVNSLVLKYLQKQTPAPVAASPEAEASHFTVYLQQDPESTDRKSVV